MAKLIDTFRSKITTGGITVSFFTSEWQFALRLCASLALFVPQSKQYRLLSDKDKAVLELLRLTQEDFLSRRNEIENQGDERSRQWFVAGIARCNLGQFYIPRDSVLKSVAMWLLPGQLPYAFVIGPSVLAIIRNRRFLNLCRQGFQELVELGAKVVEVAAGYRL